MAAIKTQESKDNGPLLLADGWNPFDFIPPSMTCGEVRKNRAVLRENGLQRGKDVTEVDWSIDALSDPERRLDITWVRFGTKIGMTKEEFADHHRQDFSLETSDLEVAVEPDFMARPVGTRGAEPELQRQTVTDRRLLLKKTLVKERRTINIEVAPAPVAPVLTELDEQRERLRKVILAYGGKRKPKAPLLDFNVLLCAKLPEVDAPEVVEEPQGSLIADLFGAVKSMFAGRARTKDTKAETIPETPKLPSYRPVNSKNAAIIEPASQAGVVSTDAPTNQVVEVKGNQTEVKVEPDANSVAVVEKTEELGARVVLEPRSARVILADRPSVAPEVKIEGVVKKENQLLKTNQAARVRVDGQGRRVQRPIEKPIGIVEAVNARQASTAGIYDPEIGVPLVLPQTILGRTLISAQAIAEPFPVKIPRKIKNRSEVSGMTSQKRWVDSFGLIVRNEQEVREEVVRDSAFFDWAFLQLIPFESQVLDSLRLGFLKPALGVYTFGGKVMKHRPDGQKV